MRKKPEPELNPLPPDIQQLVDEYRRDARIIKDYHALNYRYSFRQNPGQDTREQPPLIVIHGQEPGRTVRQVCRKLAIQAVKRMLEQGLAYLSTLGTELEHEDKQAERFIDAPYVVYDVGQPTNQETDHDDADHVFNKKRD